MRISTGPRTTWAGSLRPIFNGSHANPPAPDIAEMAPKVSEVERLRREVAELRSKLEAETPR